ncbi:hypothetical protein [Streptomyces sp.]|nr:hypothetical protein [Streptomyces sp.]HZF88975.1 hypothetical protein [Streptomyces sp.]
MHGHGEGQRGHPERQLGAEITYTPVMNLDDVRKGLSRLGR